MNMKNLALSLPLIVAVVASVSGESIRTHPFNAKQKLSISPPSHTSSKWGSNPTTDSQKWKSSSVLHPTLVYDEKIATFNQNLHQTHQHKLLYESQFNKDQNYDDFSKTVDELEKLAQVHLPSHFTEFDSIDDSFEDSDQLGEYIYDSEDFPSHREKSHKKETIDDFQFAKASKHGNLKPKKNRPA